MNSVSSDQPPGFSKLSASTSTVCDQPGDASAKRATTAIVATDLFMYVKKAGWKDWVLLEENLDRKDFDWDTTKTPSGMYRVKLVASDRHDNSPEEALTAEKVSAEVPVSTLPPTVTVKTHVFNPGPAGNDYRIEAMGVDPYLRLTEASYSIDGKRWVNITPISGIFDSKSEQFRFNTGPLQQGSTHVVMVRVKDAGGNVGSGDLVFAVPAK